MNRRSFIAGLFIAPAIIRPGLLMPVKPYIIRIRTRYVIVATMTPEYVTVAAEGWRDAADFVMSECTVRVSPMAGVLKCGDTVWIDQATGEVV